MTTTRPRGGTAWTFFSLTFLFSWGLWAPAALRHQKPGMLALVGGGFGPTLMGLLCTYLFLEGAFRIGC
jgi:hypothetical protein